MAELKISIVEFVDPGFPGWVAAEFVDAEGRSHRIVDKVPTFSVHVLDADSAYPLPGVARCQIVRKLENDRVEIKLQNGLDATDGETEFVVLASEVEGP